MNAEECTENQERKANGKKEEERRKVWVFFKIKHSS